MTGEWFRENGRKDVKGVWFRDNRRKDVKGCGSEIKE